ncbi:hypothetical protein ACWYVZ_05425 [Pediococcus acidilactici]
MKKTKLISVLVGGALTVGLAVGLAGCGNSNSDSGNQGTENQKTAKIDKNKNAFTDAEISKYLKFVPNKNTKKAYSGLPFDGTWGKLVIDSPYTKINGTLKTLKYDIKNNEGYIPRNGKKLYFDQLGEPNDDSWKKYFNKRNVQVSPAGDDEEPILEFNISGLKDPTKLDRSNLINNVEFEGQHPNLITSKMGSIDLRLVKKGMSKGGELSFDNLKIKDDKVIFPLTSEDHYMLKKEYEEDYNIPSKTIKDATGNGDSILLYNGAGLK